MLLEFLCRSRLAIVGDGRTLICISSAIIERKRQNVAVVNDSDELTSAVTVYEAVIIDLLLECYRAQVSLSRRALIVLDSILLHL